MTRRIPKKHLSYVWILITIMLSVVIIFVGNLLPISLLNITNLSEDYSQPIALDLPNLEIAADPSPEENPLVYFSSDKSIEESAKEYTMLKLQDQDQYSTEKIGFSRILQNVISYLFEMNITEIEKYYQFSLSQIIREKCVATAVHNKDTGEFVDVLFHVDIVLFDIFGEIWNISSYGTSDTLFFLNRDRYFSLTHQSKPTKTPSKIEYNDIPMSTMSTTLNENLYYTANTRILESFSTCAEYFSIQDDFLKNDFLVSIVDSFEHDIHNSSILETEFRFTYPDAQFKFIMELDTYQILGIERIKITK